MTKSPEIGYNALVNYTPDKHSAEFIAAQVSSGRYGSADEVIQESLRLLEVRDKKREELRAHLRQAMNTDVHYTFDEVLDRLKVSLKREFPE